MRHIGTYFDVNIFRPESSWELRSWSCLPPGSGNLGHMAPVAAAWLPRTAGRGSVHARPVSSCRV